MKIKRTYFHSFRNNEFFQFMVEYIDLTQNSPAVMPKIGQMFTETLLPLMSDFDVSSKKIMKNTFTEERLERDRIRDNSFRGLDNMTLAGLNHFDLEVQKLAKRIRVPFDSYKNVAQLPLNEETAAIYNLIQELRENYAAEIEALALASWINKLEADNRVYEELVKESYDEDAAKTELKAKEIRSEIEKVIQRLFERIEALIVIEGEARYAEYVRKLNLIIEKYANILAQRQGAAKARREKKQAEEQAQEQGEKE